MSRTSNPPGPVTSAVSTGGLAEIAALLDRLSFTPSRNAKLALMERYFRTVGAEEAGYALALLTGELEVSTLQGSALRKLTRTRVGDTLFDLSYAYVGDLGDTIALIWPAPEEEEAARASGIGTLAELIQHLRNLSPLEVYPFVDRFLSSTGPVERWMFVKLVTGSTLRIGVSARLAKTALAQAFDREVDEIEKIWSAFDPPYGELFAWLRGDIAEPQTGGEIFFHPLLLAHPLEERDLETEDASDFWAEWKWDGVRVQLASEGEGERRLFSRSGEDLSAAFPEVIEAARALRGVVDGELLIRQENLGLVPEGLPQGIFPDIAPFASLQKRLGRKNVSARLLTELPAFLCLYDLLYDADGTDLRDQPLEVRRAALENLFETQPLEKSGFRISPTLGFDSWQELAGLRAQARDWDVEGFMLKRRDSPYLPGRPKGLWYKWKRDPLLVDAVLIYAERGHGKRSSFFSDYTFGVWSGAEAGQGEIVPIGRAYSGFTEEELARLDRWVRDHTTERFGASVRALDPELVVEVAFDAVQRSSRHRSGVALRFPRIHRIRWDKPAAEADTLPTVLTFLR